jgi:hypothetical protein
MREIASVMAETGKTIRTSVVPNCRSNNRGSAEVSAEPQIVLDEGSSTLRHVHVDFEAWMRGDEPLLWDTRIMIREAQGQRPIPCS